MAPPTPPLLGVSPNGVLRLSCSPSLRTATVVRSSLELTNPGCQPVLFKVRTSAPLERCSIKPNCGRIDAEESARVDVAFKIAPGVDVSSLGWRLQVLSSPLPDGDAGDDLDSKEAIARGWSALDRTRIQTEDVRCRFVREDDEDLEDGGPSDWHNMGDDSKEEIIVNAVATIKELEDELSANTREMRRIKAELEGQVEELKDKLKRAGSMSPREAAKKLGEFGSLCWPFLLKGLVVLLFVVLGIWYQKTFQPI